MALSTRCTGDFPKIRLELSWEDTMTLRPLDSLRLFGFVLQLTPELVSECVTFFAVVGEVEHPNEKRGGGLLCGLLKPCSRRWARSFWSRLFCEFKTVNVGLLSSGLVIRKGVSVGLDCRRFGMALDELVAGATPWESSFPWELDPPGLRAGTLWPESCGEWLRLKPISLCLLLRVTVPVALIGLLADWTADCL
eukprot:scaffold324_cov394-Prasinococcus_capsulatus_cf.AAC.28